MAGQLMRVGNDLYRLGQDARKGYGDGFLAFRIVVLSPTEYHEEAAGEFAFTASSGPHTVNFHNGRLLFDFYREHFSLLAGFRRVASRL